MKVVLICDTYFPTGTALTSRFYHLAKLFSQCGADVHVIAAYSKENGLEVNKIYNLDTFTYQITDIKNRGSIDSFVGPNNFIKSVIQYLRNKDVDFVLTGRISNYSKLIRECRNKRIKCYMEVCEWLDISEFKFGKIDPRYIKLNLLFRKDIKKFDGVIAISSLLEKYFQAQGLKTIRIPTLIDVKKQHYLLETENERTVIVFTGNLGNKKELMGPMIDSLYRNRILQNNIEFHIYGPSLNQVVENIGEVTKILELKNVFIHGFVSHDEVLKAIKKADFQYFIRPNRKSSNAGFPTKLGESMSLGTPCITNDTGDISAYICSGENGYIIDNNIDESLEKLLIEIIFQNKQKRRTMRENARKTAEKAFDIKQYQDVLSKFLNI